jgi:hypothetical protein
MNAPVLGIAAARSRQEVVELVGFIGKAGDQLERIAAEMNRQIDMAKASADSMAQPIKAAVAEAQAKVQAWFRVHPEQAGTIPGAESFAADPMETQLAAVVLASGRPLTERQRMILEDLKAGHVLRRRHKHRSYSLIAPAPPHIAKTFVSSSHVFDLQVRFLDAFDPQTGERLLGVTAYGARAVEFRIKPDVVIP